MLDKLTAHASEPDGLAAGIGQGHELGFAGGQRNAGLELGFPGDGGTAEEKHVAGSGSSGGHTFSPARVSVADECEGGLLLASKAEREVNGATKVLQDS